MLEIPAGHIDPGEEPEAAGRRELLEETGYAGEYWHDLGAMFSGASRLTSQFRSFLALDVRKVAEPALAEAETIRIHELPWNEFVGGLHKQPLLDASPDGDPSSLVPLRWIQQQPGHLAPEAALMSRARAVTVVNYDVLGEYQYMPSDLAPAPGKAWVTPAASAPSSQDTGQDRAMASDAQPRILPENY